MTTFVRDAGNYVIHFIFMFVILATGLGMGFMFVGLAVGMLLHFAFGVEAVSTSPAILGGITVGISFGILSALFLSAWVTVKLAPTEANREKFFARASKTLGKPDLARDLGYVEEEDDDDSEGDWYTHARDRARGDEDYTVLG